MSEQTSTTETELPDAGTSQIGELEKTSHAQTVLVEHESGTYEIRWDGTNFRLLKPIGASIADSTIAYKILGHLEADLPFPLELPTLERHARIVLYAYLTPEEEAAEEDAAEAGDDDEVDAVVEE